MKKFLQWLKDNHFHQYKDGTWYTTLERPYVKGQQRKFYTVEEMDLLYYVLTRKHEIKWTKEDWLAYHEHKKSKK